MSFCSDFTNHELTLQTACCQKNTQGEENSGIGDDKFIVEQIKGMVQVKKGTFKLRVKWQGYDDETDEPLVNIREHEECECCNQFSHPFFCLQYKIMRFATYLILTGTDEHWKGIIEQARKEYKQKKELAKKEKNKGKER